MLHSIDSESQYIKTGFLSRFFISLTCLSVEWIESRDSKTKHYFRQLIPLLLCAVSMICCMLCINCQWGRTENGKKNKNMIKIIINTNLLKYWKIIKMQVWTHSIKTIREIIIDFIISSTSSSFFSLLTAIIGKGERLTNRGWLASDHSTWHTKLRIAPGHICINKKNERLRSHEVTLNDYVYVCVRARVCYCLFIEYPSPTQNKMCGDVRHNIFCSLCLVPSKW